MEEKEVQGAPVHKRRVRYSGTHPRRFEEKYKEQNPEKYADTIEKVIKKGSTPASGALASSAPTTSSRPAAER